VDPRYAKNLAVTDTLADDEERRDPYSVNKDKAPSAYGLDGSRHDASHARDREIEILGRQTRPARKEAELLDEANAEPYAWERAREQMRKRFDHAVLDIALEHLRQHDPIAYRALHAVWVYRWLAPCQPADPKIPKIVAPDAVLEAIGGAAAAACRRGLRFLSPRLAAVELARGKQLRAPGDEPETKVGRGPLRPEAGATTKHRRDEEMRRAALAGATVDQICSDFGVSKSTVYAVVNHRNAA
jgi:hypothetical protein